MHLPFLILCLLLGQAAAETPAKTSVHLPGIWTTSLVSFEAAEISQDAVKIEKNFTFAHGTFKRGKFQPHPRRGAAEKLEVLDGVIFFYLDGAEERAAFIAVSANRFKTATEEDPPTVVYYHRQI